MRMASAHGGTHALRDFFRIARTAKPLFGFELDCTPTSCVVRAHDYDRNSARVRALRCVAHDRGIGRLDENSTYTGARTNGVE
jgi:hypothetical protein